MSDGYGQRGWTLLAHFAPDFSSLRTPQASLPGLDGSSVSLPAEIMWDRSGVYALPMSEQRTNGSECSSLPSLLPTPAAGNFNDGEDLEAWEARRQAIKAEHRNGNGMGMPLSIAVRLLPTLVARDGKGRDITRDGSPSLPEFVALPPTPRASSATGVCFHGDGGMDLQTAIGVSMARPSSDGLDASDDRLPFPPTTGDA